ncbi:MAG TPA: CRISPR system precrRNA processing endoribonuclease RAMP protein Cas6 [Chloroflexota bacterium]|jgi:CRISPR-associated endoribonuclease Cas6
MSLDVVPPGVDLCSLVFRWQPGQASPAIHGRHLHAAFLAWVAARDAGLAAELHQPGQPRPFTVALLPLDGAGEATIRCTLLDRRLIAAIHARPGADQGTLRLRLSTTDHVLTAVQRDGWSSAAKWEELETIAGRRRAITLEFVTPTCFSQDIPGERKRLALFPQPAWLWGSWARKWQRFGPPLPGLEGAAQEAERWLLVSSYQLATQTLDLGRFRQKGFAGWVDFMWQPGVPAEVAQRLQMLAAFAPYAGTGYKTAMGLGVTRLRE